MHIVLMGIQGAGKGTQAEKIIDQYGYLNFETGAIIREYIANNPESDITKTVNSGNLVSDEMIAELTADFFRNNTGENILIDGAIRTLPQKRNFDTVTRDYIVLYLDLSEEEALKRLGGRRIDPETKQVFGTDFTEDTNPDTGNTLITRKDDTPEAIRSRLNAFREQTLPLIQKWEEDTGITFYNIDASGSREDVWNMIQDIINLRLK